MYLATLIVAVVLLGSLLKAGMSGEALAANVGEVQLKSLPETIGLEHSDRINRLSKLAKINGISQPKITQLQLSAGQIPGVNYPVPVVRILFDEGVFFNSNKDTVHGPAKKVVAILAECIKHDVPDVQLLILGHTDSVGSVPYNIDLSRRRAVNIMRMLMAMGVSEDNMRAIPIGMAQPIASNATEEGRSKNRRVEFMLSASQLANTHLVTLHRVISDYLPANLAAQNLIMVVPSSADVVGMSTDNQGKLVIQKTDEIKLQKPQSLSDINLNKPADYKKNELNNEFVLE